MKRALLLLLLSGAALGGAVEDYAAGHGNLHALLKNESLFVLTPSYKGTVSLVHHQGSRDKDAPTKRDLNFTAFTPDGSRYGEPDCPHPKLPAVIETTPLDGHGFGTGTFAFSGTAPTVKNLIACTTLKDLKKAVPELVRVYSEDSVHPGYWFNWFHLADDGRLQVLLLRVVDDADGKLELMEIWSGILPPDK